MKRLFFTILLTFAATSCTTDALETSQQEQALQDCVGGKNFPKAKFPAQPLWDGTQPPPPGNGWYVLWQENNDWNAVLADATTGTIAYARKVPAQQVGDFLKSTGQYGRIYVGHIPPPPPPVGDGKARFALELALRADPVEFNALSAY